MFSVVNRYVGPFQKNWYGWSFKVINAMYVFNLSIIVMCEHIIIYRFVNRCSDLRFYILQTEKNIYNPILFKKVFV